MSDEDPRRLDEDLSALIDGELDDERAAALRERLDAEPVLTDRRAAFEAVDHELRDIAAADSLHAGSVDLDRLKERLDARIAAEAEARNPEAARSGARVIAFPTARWAGRAATLGAALAAGLALYLVVGAEDPQGTPSQEIALASRGNDVPRAEDGSGEALHVPLDSGPARSAVAEQDSLLVLASLSDEEIAIAFELETLEDLDVIEQLELLEALAVLEPERG